MVLLNFSATPPLLPVDRGRGLDLQGKGPGGRFLSLMEWIGLWLREFFLQPVQRKVFSFPPP